MKVKIKIRKQARGLVGYFSKKHFHAGQEIMIEVDDLTATVEETKIELDALKFQVMEELKKDIHTEVLDVLRKELPTAEDIQQIKKFIDFQKANEANISITG